VVDLLLSNMGTLWLDRAIGALRWRVSTVILWEAAPVRCVLHLGRFCYMLQFEGLDLNKQRCLHIASKLRACEIAIGAAATVLQLPIKPFRTMVALVPSIIRSTQAVMEHSRYRRGWAAVPFGQAGNMPSLPRRNPLVLLMSARDAASELARSCTLDAPDRRLFAGECSGRDVGATR